MKDFINQYYLQVGLIALIFIIYYNVTHQYNLVSADDNMRSFYVFNTNTGEVMRFCKRDSDRPKKLTLDDLERQVRQENLPLSKYKTIEFVFDREGYDYNYQAGRNEGTNEAYKHVIRCYERE